MSRSIPQILRTLLGIFVAGLVAGVLVILVEMFSEFVHPAPDGIEGNHELMCRHVESYPAWVLAVVIPMWTAIAFASVWVARRVGDGISAIVTGALLSFAVAFNLAILPYPLWFKVGCLMLVPLAAVAGGIRRRRPKTDSND